MLNTGRELENFGDCSFLKLEKDNKILKKTELTSSKEPKNKDMNAYKLKTNGAEEIIAANTVIEALQCYKSDTD